MIRLQYKDQWYTVNELSEMSGIAPATIRDRLRRGYPVEQAIKPVAANESVERFSEASWYGDWIGMQINDLHKIYWKWCISNGYTALQKQPFSRQLMSLYPMLKTVPNKVDGKSCRIIRSK